MKRTPISELSGDSIDSKPRQMDWSEGYGEKWECYEAQKCEKCGAVLVGTGGEKHSDIDSESECDGYVPASSGPMMNYFYPLPEFRANMGSPLAAELIADLPLCVVTMGDENGLALTGGGMDLSWEICEAFMRLGFCPPLHFCDLPGMCGRGNTGSGGEPAKVSARDKWIIAGCKKSAQVAIKRARWTMHKLNSLKSSKV